MFDNLRDFYTNLIRKHIFHKSDLYIHAKNELDILLETLKDSPMDYDMQKKLNKNILKTIEAFCEFGHSGGTVTYSLDIFNRLMKYYPILPLTGKNNEWNEFSREDISNGNHIIKYYNKRYPMLLKIIEINKWGEKVSEWYNNNNNTVRENKIDFPYYPKYEQGGINDVD
ncbi:MAG: hypothetical protein IJ094_12995 [Bacilli bacterium]|nr:hypothetical protein [Bacilli bacterium]